jgi:tRNA modification GTPase
LIEASVDFSDEELPDDLFPRGLSGLAALRDSLAAALAGSTGAERVREGFEVAIVGAPNVGKSTLVNAIAGRDVALTSPVAGTTRDVIEVRCDLRGLAVTFLDMAGLREAEDPVERAGVARARARAESADLRLFLTDGSEPVALAARRPGDLVVRSKADLGTAGEGLPVSALTGVGVDRLLEAVAAELGGRTPGCGLLTRARHRAAIEGAIRDLDAAAAAPVELAAEAARRASRRLDALVGAIDVEHLLDEIFAAFCIGK